LNQDYWKSSVLALRRSFNKLSFSDGLNIGLFILTVIAIVISLWSLRVAIVTLEEARKGGEMQQRTLDASRDALVLATGLLNNQVSIQKSTLDSVKSEVNLLDSINAEPRARGFLAISILCTSEKGERQVSPILIGETENKKFHQSRFHSSFDLHLADGIPYLCTAHIRNLGNKPIDSFDFSASFPSTKSKTLDVQSGDDLSAWKTVSAGENDFAFMKTGGIILPVAQDPIGTDLSFRLKIPAQAETGRDKGEYYGTLRVRLTPVLVNYDYVALRIFRIPPS
jgi:hypothetical protein